jgi:hypothetical protein
MSEKPPSLAGADGTGLPSRGRVSLADVAREYFAYFDNALYVALLLAVLALVAADGLHLQDIGWFLLGWLFFLPQEWLTHVYVLHWICPLHETVYRRMYRLHYGHHDVPNRHDLMFMPLWLTLPMTLANYGLFALVLPDLHSAHSAFAGALFGYLLFEWMHLLCHVPVPLRGMWLRIKSRHLAHHFIDEKRCYSVSPPAQPIDRMTGHRRHGEGDQRDTPATQRSSMCRTLISGVDPMWTARAREHFAHRSNGDVHRSRLWLPANRGRHG